MRAAPHPTARAALRPVLLAVLVAAALTIGGALVSEHVFGLVPCKLCLLQRKPYYVALPLGVAALFLPSRRVRTLRLALAALAAIFAVGAVLGAYHAGAEWGFWPGPADCGGGTRAPADVGGLLDSLSRVHVVSCTEAAWRFLGLSLAGWNALISAVLAGTAAWAAWAGRPA